MNVLFTDRHERSRAGCAAFSAMVGNKAIGLDSRGFSAIVKPAQSDSVTVRLGGQGQLDSRHRRFEFVSKALRTAGGVRSGAALEACQDARNEFSGRCDGVHGTALGGYAGAGPARHLLTGEMNWEKEFVSQELMLR